MIDRWTDLPFFKERLPGIVDELRRRQETGKIILPEPDRIFAALSFFKPAETRVVIIGQDPYHTPGVANGLAFSVNPGQKPPPSLMNIFKELVDDVGCPEPTTGDLTPWAKQGVLLLNTALTVEAGSPGSHKDLGWRSLIAEIIAAVSENDDVVWVLWGNHAGEFKSSIPPWHPIIESPHPSPLSAHRGFFGSRPFSRVNAALKTGRIEWRL